MIKIDGSLKSGSGTILRYAVSLCALVGKDLFIYNIRKKRNNPGLRPQHLKAIEAVCKLCDGRLEGAKVGSTEIRFFPSDERKGGNWKFSIGTAGSTTMLAMTILPVSIFCKTPCEFLIEGGLFQDFAPSAFHMKNILFEILKKMNIKVNLEIIKPGYVPTGGGVIKLTTTPTVGKILPIQMREQGQITQIEIITISSFLERQRVSDRLFESALEVLQKERLTQNIKKNIIYDKRANQKGAAICIIAKTSCGCLIGSDMAGAIGRPSEYIGRQSALNLIEDIKTKATVDRFLADQLILFAALASGKSIYKIPRLTDHIESNLWLIKEILQAEYKIEDNFLEIEGIGYFN